MATTTSTSKLYLSPETYNCITAKELRYNILTGQSGRVVLEDQIGRAASRCCLHQLLEILQQVQDSRKGEAFIQIQIRGSASREKILPSRGQTFYHFGSFQAVVCFNDPARKAAHRNGQCEDSVQFLDVVSSLAVVVLERFEMVQDLACARERRKTFQR